MADMLTMKNLVECLNRLKNVSNEKVLQDETFQFFHKHRNFFNYKASPTGLTLTEKKDGTFVDNHKRVWKELTYGNAYHHPYGKNKRAYGGVTDYPRHLYDVWVREPKDRFSRKFISQDQRSIKLGYSEGCEFEMIVHRSSYRIVSGNFMETYNFGPTAFRSSIGEGLHKKFDINPHEKLSSDYITSYYKKYKVHIK